MILVEVKILPKAEVLDVQGRAIADKLQRSGRPVEDCQYGKLIKLKIKAGSREEALKTAEETAKSVLCNSLVEDYELEISP